jgi:hypothetical protein
MATEVRRRRTFDVNRAELDYMLGYVEDGKPVFRPSLAMLARKYGVDPRVGERHASKRKWVRKRRLFWIDVADRAHKLRSERHMAELDRNLAAQFKALEEAEAGKPRPTPSPVPPPVTTPEDVKGLSRGAEPGSLAATPLGAAVAFVKDTGTLAELKTQCGALMSER